MDDLGVALAGAAVGSLLTLIGSYFQRLWNRNDRREEFRRDAYSEWLAEAEITYELAEEILQLGGSPSIIQKDVAEVFSGLLTEYQSMTERLRRAKYRILPYENDASLRGRVEALSRIPQVPFPRDGVPIEDTEKKRFAALIEGRRAELQELVDELRPAALRVRESSAPRTEVQDAERLLLDSGDDRDNEPS